MIENSLRQVRRLPIDMFIVRNGLNEGAVAMELAKSKKNFDYLKSITKVHSSRWRLTDFGRLQAKATGKWINEHHNSKFDAYLTGEFVRSIETAACMNLPDAKWIPSLYLRPKDFGDFSITNRPLSVAKSHEEEFEQHMRERARDTFYWTPPNGESIAHLTLRTERVIHWIRNHVSENGSVLLVTNKSIMETLRIRIEHISQSQYEEIIKHPLKSKVINFCSVIHYTRRNPKTGEVVPKYKWMRIVTPWMGRSYAPEKFDPIKYIHYANEDLLAEVSNVPRLF